MSIENVYNTPQDRAVSTLSDQGLEVRSIEMCSNSIVAGRVRQVYREIDNQEVVLVDEDGVTDAGYNVEPGEEVIVKVSSGDCD